MTLASLVWASFTRNWLRSSFVLVAVIAAFSLFGALETLRFQREAPPADGNIINVSSDGMGGLPITYENEILALEGVLSATAIQGLPLQNPESASQPMIVAGVNSATVAATLPGMYLTPELTARWRAIRNGAICDERTMRERGWRVTDHLSFALLAGMVTKKGTNQLEVVIVGTYRNGSLLSNLVTHADYLTELMPFPPPVGTIVVQPRDAGRAPDLARRIDRHFETQPQPTRSTPLSEFRRQSLKRFAIIGTIIRGTLAVSFFTMVLIVANALAQSVRERLGEMALLHALGFQGRTVLLLVLAESLAMLAVGAVAGLALATGAFALHIVEAPDNSLLLPLHTVLFAALIVLGSALIAVLLPCWELARLPVADALRRL